MSKQFHDLLESKPKPKGIAEVASRVRRNVFMQDVDSRLRLLAKAAKTAVTIDGLLDSSVLVALRIRPLLGKELDGETRRDNNICLRDGSNPGEVVIVANNDSHKETKFKLDAVLSENVPQEQMYAMTAKRILVKVLKGYNGTVFAYGQTGSGKTFTMLGPDGGTVSTTSSSMGLIPRAIREIFDTKERNPGTVYNISCSYTEIYKEEIRDLLRKSVETKTHIKIRTDKNGDVTLDGAIIKEVSHYEDVMKLIKRGNGKRQVGGHALNAHSSRSHAVFTIYIQQCAMQGSRGVKLNSKFHLIDLAGSERAKRTGASGNRLKEGSAINSSLSALGNVIKALTDGVSSRGRSSRKKKGHVPFRDSLLTRILRDSLGGNSFTLMICNVSPHISHSSETMSSLRFAERVKLVQNSVKINSEALSADQARDLQKINEQLVEKLEEMQRSQQLKMEATINRNDEEHQQEMQRVTRDQEELRLRVERAEKERQALNHLVKAAATHDIKRICTIADESARSIMDAEGSRIYFIDEDTGELWYSTEDGNRVNLSGHSIAGHVGRSGKMVMLHKNVGRSEHYDEQVDCIGGPNGNESKSLLSMPIRHGDTVVGVIAVFNKNEDAPWSSSDAEALSVLCDHIAAEVKREVHGGAEGELDPIAALLNTFHEPLLDLTQNASNMKDLGQSTAGLLEKLMQDHQMMEATLFFIVEQGSSDFPEETPEEWDLFDPVTNTRVPMDDPGILGRCLEDGQVIDLQNVKHHNDYTPQIDKPLMPSNAMLSSCVMLPLHKIPARSRASSSFLFNEEDGDDGERRGGQQNKLSTTASSPRGRKLSIVKETSEGSLGDVCAVLRIWRGEGATKAVFRLAEGTVSYVQNAVLHACEEAARERAAKIMAAKVKQVSTQRRASTFRHNTQLALHKKHTAKHIGTIEHEHKTKLETIKNNLLVDFDHKQQVLKDQLRQAHEQMDDMFETQTNEMDKVVTKHKKEKDELSTTLANVRLELKEKVANLKRSHQDELEDINSNLGGREETLKVKIRSVQRDMDDMLEEHTMELKKIRREHTTTVSKLEDQVVELTEELERATKGMRDNHAKSLSGIREDHESALREIERKLKMSHRRELESHQEERETELKMHKDQLKDYKNNHIEEIKQQNHEHLKQLEKMAATKEREKQSHLEEELTKLKAEHSETVEQLEIESNALRDAMVELENNHTSTSTDLGAEKSARRLSQFRHAADHSRAKRIREELDTSKMQLAASVKKEIELQSKFAEQAANFLEEKESMRETFTQNTNILRENITTEAKKRFDILQTKTSELQNELDASQTRATTEKRRTEDTLAMLEQKYEDVRAVTNNKLHGQTEMLDAMKQQLHRERAASEKEFDKLEKAHEQESDVITEELRKTRAELLRLKVEGHSNHIFVGMIGMFENSIQLQLRLERWRQEIKVKVSTSERRLSKLLDAVRYADQSNSSSVTSPLRPPGRKDYQEEEDTRLAQISMNTRKEDTRLKSEATARRRAQHNTQMAKQHENLQSRHSVEMHTLTRLHDSRAQLKKDLRRLHRHLSRIRQRTITGDIEEMQLMAELQSTQRDLTSTNVEVEMCQQHCNTFEIHLQKLRSEIARNQQGDANEDSTGIEKIQNIFEACTLEVKELQSIVRESQSSMETFENHVLDSATEHRQKFSNLYSQIDELSFSKESAERRADDVRGQLLEMEERSMWLEGLIENTEDVREIEHIADDLRGQVENLKSSERHLIEQGQRLRESLGEANERVALLTRMLRLPSLRNNVDRGKGYGRARTTVKSNGRDPFESTLTASFDKNMSLSYSASSFGDTSRIQRAKGETTSLLTPAPTTPTGTPTGTPKSSVSQQRQRMMSSSPSVTTFSFENATMTKEPVMASPGRTREIPAVDVFTSTLHTVFVYFAKKRTHQMGKAGFRNFYRQCPGLMTKLKDGQLEVIFSRSANKKHELDFGAWVDSLLWISVIKYQDTSNILVSFWRILSEHVLLFSWVPVQVQQGALAASGSRLSAHVLFQATGKSVT